MYTIKFKDNTQFQGGNLEYSKWNEIPEKEIDEIIYNLFDKTLVLKKYDSYNHLIERVHLFGDERITKVILMGRKGDEVDLATFDFDKKQVYKSKAQFGKEYNGKPTAGWKRGLNEILEISS